MPFAQMTLTEGSQVIVLSIASLGKSEPSFLMDRMNYMGDCPAGTLISVEAVSLRGGFRLHQARRML